MLVIILLFVLFGTGNKFLYLISFVGMIAAAYFITDPENIPAFVVENSIIVQSLLSILLLIKSLHLTHVPNHRSVQAQIHWQSGPNHLGVVIIG